MLGCWLELEFRIPVQRAVDDAGCEGTPTEGDGSLFERTGMTAKMIASMDTARESTIEISKLPPPHATHEAREDVGERVIK